MSSTPAATAGRINPPRAKLPFNAVECASRVRIAIVALTEDERAVSEMEDIFSPVPKKFRPGHSDRNGFPQSTLQLMLKCGFASSVKF
jgi:hypothetical protein